MAIIREGYYSPHIEISLKDVIKEEVKEMLNEQFGTKGSKEGVIKINA